MDTITLVEEQIDDGQRLLDQLSLEEIPVLAACWVKPTDEDRWSLYIATPLTDEKGAARAYREVYRVLRSLENSWVKDSEVKLIGEKHPITKDVQDIMRRYPGRTPTRSRQKMLGGSPIDEVYVYPALQPTFKGFDDIKRRFPSAEIFTITIRCPQIPPVDNIGAFFHQLSPFMGKVNANEFEGKAPETVLFMGPRGSSERPLALLIFVLRPEGWNTLYREETKSWERVMYANGKPLYEPVDFSPLAAMKAEQADEQSA